VATTRNIVVSWAPRPEVVKLAEPVENDVIFVGPDVGRSAASETSTKCVARR
jgi:hypothetical protein